MLERNSLALTPRRARSIANLVDEGPLSRTFLYSAIKEGRLKARKAGRRTVVLDDDYRAFLQALPVIGVPELVSGVGGRYDAGN
jgi:hypothetical protein